MRRCDVNVVVIVNRGGMHEARHLARRMALFLFQFFIVIVHGGLIHVPLGCSFSIQVVTKVVDTFAAENTKDLALLASELGGGIAAKPCQFLP